ncbi:cytosine permease [Leucobacter viscericola]|uniref:Cytosine permease n=1 Tax=Leucobacter viscericola TaxID=2714935 RepID=A0A6G7XC26_9MICO|nr:cytosine permease [Leucobacter viscericola]QIK61957.1 cytosine permease [Leucobacter viscericola]
MVKAETEDTTRGSAASGAPGWRLALILLGILVTPVVLSAPTLGTGLPMGSMIAAILVGAVILTLLASLTLSIGQHARQPTYDIVRFPFGRLGAKAVTVLLAVSLFGWSAVTANGFGLAVSNLLSTSFGISVPLPILVTIGCIIFVASTAFGFEVIGKVAQWAVPVIVLILGFLVFQSLSAGLSAHAQSGSMPWGVAVSTVVGTAIVLVVTAADFGSFTRSRKHAIVGAILTFLVAYPLLYVAGAIPSVLTGKGSLIDAMGIIASVVPAIILMVIASVTANAGNMFQGTLAFANLFNIVRKKWMLTVALGIGVAVIGSMDVGAWLPSFLLFLGVAAPPVAGIYIVDFALYRRRGYDESVLKSQPAVRLDTYAIWFAGSILGFLCANGILTITSVPSLDSLLFSALLYGALGLIRRQRA